MEFGVPMYEWHDAVHSGRDLPSLPANHAPNSRVAKCRTWKQQVLQGEQAEEITVRVKAEENESKLRPEKSTRCASESSS